MKIKTLLFIVLFTKQLFAQSYQKIHHDAIVVDTHNDILMKVVDKGLVFDQDLSGKAHTDLARWKKGGLDVQLFSVYCDGDLKNSYAYANRSIDSLDAVVTRRPDQIVKVANYRELQKAIKQHKIAAMVGVEGGHMIEDDLSKLDALYQRGVRYLTLTHNIAPSWATSAADETTNPNLAHKGLTDFGKKVVQRMNQLGMLVDVSHAGDQTFWDVINLSKKPIIASHSSVYSLVPSRRNLKDEQIKAIAKNGGVIQINFNPGFIDRSFAAKETAFLKKHVTELDSLMKGGLSDFYAMDTLYKKYKAETDPMRPPLAMLIDHIEYIIKLVGVDYVGLGSDFDGINLTPQQLDDVTDYPLITKALIEKGYAKKDIDKILGGNFLRVLKANEVK
ncbi:MAG: dipeptidase [Bacteroidetes bacterium]|nr:dipeptidase [Bacteroidota bacterium]MBU1371597.1 dipeptidase [Bacteroidota bacterium]MBU1484116.1 dipeptidase [Bacteroidota bacterium]MBU1759851.1 dipeptidase [Bacteroidota bacterium]MBU2266691.1 dipeptidase [Bacteroidota bacterium]